MSSVPEFDAAKYYLGGLCRRGHDWNGTGKSLRFKPSRLGVGIECHNERSREYRKNNPEARKEIQKRYRENNKEKVAETNRNYRLNNPDKEKAKQQRYRKRHAETLRKRNLTNYYRHHEARKAQPRKYSKSEQGRKAGLRAAYKRRARSKNVHVV